MYRNPFFFASRIGKPLLILSCLVLGLGGCALTQPFATKSAGVLAESSAGQPLDAALAAFLAQAPVGAVQVAADSPWGSQAEITVEDRYLAASGRDCRRLRVASAGAGAPIRAIACQSAQGWDARRLVIDAGAAAGATAGATR